MSDDQSSQKRLTNAYVFYTVMSDPSAKTMKMPAMSREKGEVLGYMPLQQLPKTPGKLHLHWRSESLSLKEVAIW